MNRFFTLLLAASCLTAVGQVPDYVPTDGLVAWYPLDGHALDHHSGQLHGVASEPIPSDNRNQQLDSALFFDGTDDRITLPDFTQTEFGLTHFSVNAWVFLSEAKRHWVISNYKTAVGNSTVLALGSEVVEGDAVLHVDIRHPYGDSNFFGSNPIELNEWHMVSLIRNGGEIRLFLDGQEDAISELVLESSDLRNGWPFHFGMENGNGQFWHGKLDDLGLWDRALNEAEISGLFESTNVGGCTDMTACNFDADVASDDGSCHFNCQFCHDGTVWDEDLFKCVVANPSDSNFDGCVQLNDLLDLLTAYGNCGAEESAWQCGDPLDYQGHGYETVQIGEQCWFAENLRAENYKNGDFISANLDNSEWTSTTSGATVFYGDDVSSLQAYGRLYNWHAVDDARSLCPNAWRIPSDGDWTVLTDFLGGSATAGAQMKTTDGWNGDGDGANSSGFSGLPGGSRASNGNFYLAGSSGYWWSATPYGSSAWYRIVSYNDDSVNRNFAYHRNGYSVRCVRDAQ